MKSEILELLARATSDLEARQRDIRERLLAAQGNPHLLSAEDRLTYTSASRGVRAIGHLRFLLAVGATDDIPGAVAELKNVCHLLSPTDSSSTRG